MASKLFETSVIRRAGQLMITVLTGTRHKGAVESAASALAEFSSQLLLSKDFCNLPGEWLHDVIGKYIYDICFFMFSENLLEGGKKKLKCLIVPNTNLHWKITSCKISENMTKSLRHL